MKKRRIPQPYCNTVEGFFFGSLIVTLLTFLEKKDKRKNAHPIG
jgi:hypothetical protein